MNEQPPESITNTLDMRFNKIPAGTFMMGSPETEEGVLSSLFFWPFPPKKNKLRIDNEHQHKVTISKAFYMQNTVVTQWEWKAVMGTEPWTETVVKDPWRCVKEGPYYPASYVSWDDAIAYCKKLSQKESVTYRLPTEAEWEYACRAGTKTAWSCGNDQKKLGDYAWYYDNTSMLTLYPHQVRLKKPNAFGLYDMHGNVSELCHDYWEADYYKRSPEKDPTGPATGDMRVERGGYFRAFFPETRSAYRGATEAFTRIYNGGFRLVRDLD
jgi:formylglycine-generating enzyme required for sulfatase activity